MDQSLRQCRTGVCLFFAQPLHQLLPYRRYTLSASVWVAVYAPVNTTASATFIMDNNNGTVYTHPTPIVSTAANNNLSTPNWQQITFEFDFNFADGTPYFSFQNETASSRPIGMLFDDLVIREVSCPVACTIPVPSQPASCGTNLLSNGTFETLANPVNSAFNDQVTGVPASFLEKDNDQSTGNTAAPTWSGPAISSPTASTVASRTVAAFTK